MCHAVWNPLEAAPQCHWSGGAGRCPGEEKSMPNLWLTLLPEVWKRLLWEQEQHDREHEEPGSKWYPWSRQHSHQG